MPRPYVEREKLMLNFDQFEVLTFDCYGTMIDWETGVIAALDPIFKAHGVEMARDEAFRLYRTLEPEAEHGTWQNYKGVLRTVLKGFGEELGFTPTEAELDQFAYSVRDWPAFPDSPSALLALNKKYKLGVLSNVDDDLFAYSAKKLEALFTYVITAEQIHSYKPAPKHFETAFERIGLPKEKILHVAQSLFHDIQIAKSLGLSTVWVNRGYGRGVSMTPPAEAVPDLEVPDLATLARLVNSVSH